MRNIGNILLCLTAGFAAPALAQAPGQAHSNPTGDGTVQGAAGEFKQFVVGLPPTTVVTVTSHTSPGSTPALNGAVTIYRCKTFGQTAAASQCDMITTILDKQSATIMMQGDVMFAASSQWIFDLSYHYEIIGGPQSKAELPR